MSASRGGHLVERAVERMAQLGGLPLDATRGPGPPPNLPPPGLPSIPPSNPEPPPDILGTARGLPGEVIDPTLAEPAPVTLAALEAAGMAVAGTRRSRIAEEWGITTGTLLRALRAPRPATIGSQAAANLLMITSSKPNEGKSFSALNLAGSLTVSGLAEVLLMDIDSKPGALSDALGLGGRPGLFDLVADPTLRPEDLALRTDIKGLSILPIGRAAADGPGSVERTVTRRVVTVIEQVARRFTSRVIILDTAPCLATSDASTLAPAVGQIAMIVEAQRTQRDDLEAALDLLRPCPHIILVLNKVRQVTSHAFGEYHYYDG